MPPVAIDLKVGEQRLHFESANEFEFALAGRTSLPHVKISALNDLADDALLREVSGIRQVEQRFVNALEQSLSEPGVIGDFMRTLDLSVVSKDYQWRDIVESLVELDSDYDAYKKVALVKYMQYLAARQEIVRSAYSSRQAGRKHGPGSSEGPADPRKSETYLFDLTPFVSNHRAEGEFERLPKGETIEIPFEADNSVDLILAKHRFSIVCGDEFCFVDDKDHYSVLRPGKNIVGRDASSDVVIDANYRAVSRRHLIVETEGTSLVRLTDISSLGTFVPPKYLDRTRL